MLIRRIKCQEVGSYWLCNGDIMAGVNIIKEAIDICSRTDISLFIWGHRGLGKSSIVKQYAATNNIGFIDLRCSQLEASDIRGLPDAVEGQTKYLPPVDMPSGGMDYEQILSAMPEGLSEDNTSTQYRSYMKKMQPLYNRGILFLDEVNRAQDDVQQAIFELVLDKSIGQYVLPTGWSIVAAGNYMEGYITNGFNDSAFLDRFCHISLSAGESTLIDWIEYMTSVYGELASDVIEFASHNVDHLDGKVEGDLGFNIQPSRRSWEMLNKVGILAKQRNYSNESVLEVYSGLVGRDLAISYLRYSCPVKPADLVEKGVAKYKKSLDKLARNQLCGLMWGLVASCKRRIGDDTISGVCIDFARYMIVNGRERDLVVAFCRALVNDMDKPDEIKSAAISNPSLAKLISKFNDKRGDNQGKNFIDRLNEVPELQQALANISWGKDD